MVLWDCRLTVMVVPVGTVPKASECAQIAARWYEKWFSRNPLPMLRGAGEGRRAIPVPTRTRTPDDAMGSLER